MTYVPNSPEHAEMLPRLLTVEEALALLKGSEVSEDDLVVIQIGSGRGRVLSSQVERLRVSRTPRSR